MQGGDVIDGRFTIEALAGAGGMGAVYRARDRATGEIIAMKVLRGAAIFHADRFEREATLLAQLQHPAIVRYVAHGSTPEGPYLAMEWLDGVDLHDYLGDRWLPVSEALRLAARVADALAVAHRVGVVHRDIKPSNLFLVGSDIDKVKVIDFGVARVRQKVLTESGVAIGTPGYMAPEQARGDRGVDARADVFSLGCVLFECLTGRPPFTGEHIMAVLAKILLGEAPRLRELRPALDERLERLLVALLAKDPAHRPSDGAAARVAIDALGEVEEPSAEDTERAPRATAVMGTVDQEVVCILALWLGERAATDPSGVEPTLVEGDAPLRGALEAVASSFGGRIEWPADGSVVVALSGAASATDQAVLASRCALAVRELVPEAPAALATGKGVVTSWRAAGEAIDRAAALLRRLRKRVEGAPASPAPIVIDEVTAGLLPPRFQILEREDAFELRGVVEGTGAARSLLGRATPYVGRDHELRWLLDLQAQSAEEGQSAAAAVVGAAGSGKSRLLDELVLGLRAKQDAPQIWMAAGDPLTRGAPLALLGRALWHGLSLSGAHAGERKELLRSRVARHVAATAAPRVAAFLGELAGVPFDDSESFELAAARQDPQLMGDQVRRAWLDLVRAECAAGPLVLVLDDLHWGDKETVGYVHLALRELAESPLLCIGLTRPESDITLSDSRGGRTAVQLELRRLSAKASEKLVRAVLGASATPEVVQRVVEHAEGNPFYLEELLRAVAAGHGEALPETVLAMVHTRLASLGDMERRVLRAAAVFGRVFQPAGIAALTGIGAAESRALLEQLVEHEVLVRPAEGSASAEPSFAFRHALVREAAGGMSTDEDRTLGHRLAGEWLERSGSTDAALLAEHYELGGDRERAAGWYGRAARGALERNAFDAAVAAAERAIECGASGEPLGRMYLCAASARFWQAQFAAAQTYAKSAVVVLRHDTSEWFAAASRLAETSAKVGRIDDALDTLAELAESDPEEGAIAAYLSAAAQSASQLVVAGRAELAASLLARATGFERAVADPAARGYLAAARGITGFLAGDYAGTLRELQIAASCFDAADDLRMGLVVRANIGHASAELGEYALAERALREAIVAAHSLGTPNAGAYAKHNLGLMLARHGQFDDGEQVQRESLALALSSGDRRLEGGCRISLARISLLRGDPSTALREAALALPLARDLGPTRSLLLAVLVQAHLESGDQDKAATVASELRALLEAVDPQVEAESFVRLVTIEALRVLGDARGAARALQAARDSVLARAAKIESGPWRDAFLNNVPENARILRLADELPTKTTM